MIEFGRLSWYGVAKGQASSEIDFNSPAVISTLSNLEFLSRLNKHSIALDEAFRPDMTSLKLYKSSKYFWVLMQVNGITDPWQQWYATRKIIYPNLGDIASALNRIKVELENESSIREYIGESESDLGRSKPR